MTRHARLSSVLAAVLAALPTHTSGPPTDERVRTVEGFGPGEADQSGPSTRSRGDAGLAPSLSGAKLPASESGPRPASKEEVARLVFRVRRHLGEDPGEISPWVVRRADKHKGGYRLTLVNLDTLKIYEVDCSGPDITVIETY